MKTKYFGNNIKPACEYCAYGNLSLTGDKVLCERIGMVDCDHSCKKFIYDPIRRVPKRQREMSAMD